MQNDKPELEQIRGNFPNTIEIDTKYLWPRVHIKPENAATI